MARIRVEGLEDALKVLNDNPAIKKRARQAALGAAAKEAEKPFILEALKKAPEGTGKLKRSLKARGTDKEFVVSGSRAMVPQNAETKFLDLDSSGNLIAISFTKILDKWIRRNSRG